MNEKLLYDFLNKNNIKYKIYDHQPVFTVDDKAIVTAVDGVKTNSAQLPEPVFKTLFLKDKKDNYFLVSVIEDKRVDLNALSIALNSGRFSFVKADELLQILNLTPGSVTPYGLLFDKENKVKYILDQDALNYTCLGFHPMRNDKTIVLGTKDFLTCMELMNHKTQILCIPVK